MLAGSAYAGAKIGSKDIARDAVKAKHINAGAVRAEELAGFEVASATGKLALDVDTTSITDTETADLAASPNGKLRLEARCFWEGQLDMVLVAGVRLVATDTGSLLSGTQGNMPFSKGPRCPTTTSGSRSWGGRLDRSSSNRVNSRRSASATKCSPASTT